MQMVVLLTKPSSIPQAETQPGFINALLDILQGEQVNAVQLSGTFCRLFTSLLMLNRSPSAL